MTARAVVVLPVTLHARPAALIAQAVGRGGADVRLDGANARSVTELMCLDARAGRRVELIASGPGADEAVTTLREVIARLGDPPADDGPGR